MTDVAVSSAPSGTVTATPPAKPATTDPACTLTLALPQKTLEVADARVTASYRMTRNLYLDLRADYRDQVSNDGRIAYNRNQLILGVRWEQ